jgi:hypothetical protein
MTGAPIQVIINRRDIALPGSPITAELILQAGDYGPDYDLFVLRDENDASGGIKLERSETIDVESGMQFRAIPGNAMFGETQRVALAVAGNSVLEEDLQRLSEQGFDYQLLVEPPDIGIVIRDVPLPEGVFSQQNTDVLLKTTYLYPQSEMDMFWVEPDLRLASGAEPLATNLEVHFDQPWRRFSWHRNCPWIPGRDDLLTHLEFARARLENPQ